MGKKSILFWLWLCVCAFCFGCGEKRQNVPESGSQSVEYDWAGPCLSSRQVVVVQADSAIYSLSDLTGKTVAAQAGSSSEEWLISGENPRIPEVGNLMTFSDMDDVYASLRDSYCDAIAGNDCAMQKFMDAEPGKYRMLEESLCVPEEKTEIMKESR